MSAGIRIAERTARKQHPCYWCREPIATGHRYVESTAAQDGRIETWRAHPECGEAEQRAVKYHGAYAMHDEPACCGIDYDGGYHQRGQNCPECSDLPMEAAS